MSEQKDQEHRFNVVTSGNNIRIEPAKSSRQSGKKSKVILSVAQEIKTPGSGFVGFLREYAVVGLIIGFVLGAQVQTLAKQLVQSFLDPLTHLLFGTALSDRTFTLRFKDRAANFSWGAFVYSIVIFLLVMITLYVVIKIFNLDKLEKSKAKEDKK